MNLHNWHRENTEVHFCTFAWQFCTLCRAAHLKKDKKTAEIAQVFGVLQPCCEKLAEKSNANEIMKDG